MLIAAKFEDEWRKVTAAAAAGVRERWLGTGTIDAPVSKLARQLVSAALLAAALLIIL